MANFNDLIKEDPNLAAGILLNSFRGIINNLVPNVYLTKDEFKQLSAIIIAGEAKDPSDVYDTGDDNGDDCDNPSDTVQPKFGIVSAITSGANVNQSSPAGIQVNVANVNLNWSKADPAAGRISDGWWIGIKMTAPDDMRTEEAFADVTYKTKGSTGWSAAKSFWNAQDSKKAEADTVRFIQLWGLVDVDKINTAKSGNKNIEYQWMFDWNADGEYEQLVTLTIDPSNVTLNKDGSVVWPEAE